MRGAKFIIHEENKFFGTVEQDVGKVASLDVIKILWCIWLKNLANFEMNSSTSSDATSFVLVEYNFYDVKKCGIRSLKLL